MANNRRQNSIPLIDEQEKQWRLEAARDAEASLRIAGLFISSESKALSNKWINGEITDEEYEQLSRLSE